jgi:hypothetical protein
LLIAAHEDSLRWFRNARKLSPRLTPLCGFDLGALFHRFEAGRLFLWLVNSKGIAQRDNEKFVVSCQFSSKSAA